MRWVDRLARGRGTCGLAEFARLGGVERKLRRDVFGSREFCGSRIMDG